MFRISLLLIAGLTLNGCGLTKIPESWHDKEVEGLNTIGLTLSEARTVATRKGFKCSDNIQRRTFWTGETSRKADTIECYKQSIDLICPQTRYAILKADPRTGRVFSAGGHMREHTCF